MPHWRQACDARPRDPDMLWKVTLEPSKHCYVGPHTGVGRTKSVVSAMTLKVFVGGVSGVVGSGIGMFS